MVRDMIDAMRVDRNRLVMAVKTAMTNRLQRNCVHAKSEILSHVELGNRRSRLAGMHPTAESLGKDGLVNPRIRRAKHAISVQGD